jgi:hypothetical protein
MNQKKYEVITYHAEKPLKEKIMTKLLRHTGMS